MKERKAILPVLILLCALLLAGCSGSGSNGSRDSFQTASDLNRPDVTIGGQTVDMTIDNLTLEHAGGGLISSIECRRGVV